MNWQTIAAIGGLIALILGPLINFVYGKGKSDKLEENLNLKIDQHILDDERMEASIKNQVQKLWEWKDAHERDVSDKRYELQKQLGKMEAGISIHDNQYNEIIRLIENMNKSIGDKVDKLEEEIKQFRKN